MNKIVTFICFALTSILLYSCSDDSDKIDSFFKEKVSKLSKVSIPSVTKVYPNAVMLESEPDGDFFISTSKQEIESGRGFWIRGIGVTGGNDYCFNGLEPNTTYFYRMIVADYTQVALDEYGDIFSETKQFTTSRFTAGNVVRESETQVRIESPIFRYDHHTGFYYYSLAGKLYVRLYSDSSMTKYVGEYGDKYRNDVNEDGMECITIWSLITGQTYYYQFRFVYSDKEYLSETGQFTL